MTIGLIGRKRGMTRVFTEQGDSVPVTVVEVSPNRITQVKTVETDGYRALQVTLGTKRTSLLNKPKVGHFSKAEVEAGEGLWELRLSDDEGADLETGAELKVDQFEIGQMVDVTGTSKGKGFAGVSNDTTSQCRTQLTVIHCRIVHRAQLASARHRVAYSRARKWLVTWVTNVSPPRTLK